MDINTLASAVENIKNESIIETNIVEINNIKKKVLKQLHLSQKTEKDFLNKLYKYRYVDELTDLNSGDYIRWVNLNDAANIKLNNGAFICDIEICEDGIHLKLKTVVNRYLQIKMDEAFIFQKLSDDELIVLSALKYLNN